MIDELIQTMACAASPPPEQAVSAVTAVPCFCTAHWPSPLAGELRAAGLEDAGLSRRSVISSPPG